MRLLPFALSILAVPAFALPAHAVVRTVPGAEYPSIQSAITASVAGDTVFVKPGDYLRTVVVDKAIRLEGSPDGPVRVPGLTGSLVHVVRLTFTTSLSEAGATLVAAGDGVTLELCRFEGPVQGVLLNGADLVVEACVFTNQLLAVYGLGSPHHVTLRGCSFTDCAQILRADGAGTCPGGDRAPAAACEGTPCSSALVENCAVLRSDHALELGPDWDVTVTGTSFIDVNGAIEAGYSRVRVEDSTLSGSGTAGAGLELTGCSGYLRRSTVGGFQTGVAVADGGCSVYGTFILGGALSRGNTISGNVTGLLIAQPEWVNADYNYWGVFECAAAQASVSGQSVHIIADAFFLSGTVCTVPTHPVTWGRLKRGGGRP